MRKFVYSKFQMLSQKFFVMLNLWLWVGTALVDVFSVVCMLLSVSNNASWPKELRVIVKPPEVGSVRFPVPHAIIDGKALPHAGGKPSEAPLDPVVPVQHAQKVLGGGKAVALFQAAPDAGGHAVVQLGRKGIGVRHDAVNLGGNPLPARPVTVKAAPLLLAVYKPQGYRMERVQRRGVSARHRVGVRNHPVELCEVGRKHWV